jgi:hypothetical protein
MSGAIAHAVMAAAREQDRVFLRLFAPASPCPLPAGVEKIAVLLRRDDAAARLVPSRRALVSGNSPAVETERKNAG